MSFFMGIAISPVISTVFERRLLNCFQLIFLVGKKGRK